MSAVYVRPAAVADVFYPSAPERLRGIVDGYMAASGVTPAPERVRAIVAPHAGYRFSGATAGHVYQRVRGKRVKRVLLVGCSHHFHFERAAVVDSGVFATALGDFPVDEEFAAGLIEQGALRYLRAHEGEHSLEVQLPFVAAAIGVVPIVPVLFGAASSAWHAEWGRQLAEMSDESDLMVISTDLSHFLHERQANMIDRFSIATLLQGDWRKFADSIARGESSMCGATAATVGMNYALAKGAEYWELLDYRTSASASGNYERVVGYAAVSMERAA